MADVITYVGAGTASATDGSSNPTPTLPASVTDDDLMLLFVYTRENVDGSITEPSGWTEIVQDLGDSGLLAVFYRFYVAGDGAPTVALVNHASGDTAFAHIAAWRGVDTTSLFDQIGTVTENTAATNIGAIAGINAGRKALIVVFGGKQDDWTSVATLSGESLSWQEIAETDSTLGNDAGQVWDYAINTGLELAITDKTFTVSGGSSQPGKGVIISFALGADVFDETTDLVLYCAQSHPLTDSGSPGGPVDPYMRAVFTDLAANDDVEAISDDANDTNVSAIVKGRNSSGELVQEIKQLNGTSAVIFSTMGLIDDMESFQLTEPAVGTITVRRSPSGATIGTIPPGELGFRRIFFGAYSHPNNAKTYYEKIFLKNNHPITTVQTMSIVESADPGALVTFTLAASVDDEAYADSRLDVPSTDDTDPDTFDGTSKDVPGSGSNIDPGSAVGIWLKMSVSAGAAATKNTYTLQFDGGVAP